MDPTLDDLIVVTLQKLGEVGDGQAPSAEAADKARRRLPSILADLQARAIYAPPSDTTIHPAALGHLSDIAAAALATSFGVSGDEIVVLASQAQAAEGKLRVLRTQRPSYATQPACFY